MPRCFSCPNSIFHNGTLFLAFFASLGIAACLKINPDYNTPAAQRDDAVKDFESSNSTGPADGHGIATGETSLGSGDVTGPPNSSNDAEAQTTATSMTTNQDTLTNSETSSSSAPDGQRSDTSDTGSDTSQAPSNWRAIDIDARQTNDNVPDGYTLSLEVDHAAMVAAGAASNGSDLSIVLRRGQSSESINRVLDPESSWNSNKTKIWFAINGPIAQGTRNNTEYFLVINDPTLAPVSDPEDLFFVFDDFDQTNTDPARWSSHTSSDGTRSITKIGAGQRLSAKNHDTYPLVYYSIRHNAKSLPNKIRVDARTRYNFSDLVGTCGRIFPISLKSQNDGHIRASLRINLFDYDVLSYDDAQGINTVDIVNSAFPNEGSWATHSLTWHGQDLRYYKNATELLHTQNHGNVTQPDQTPLALELSAGLWTNDCVGNGDLRLDVDWVRIRPDMHPAPTAQLQ